MTQMTKHIIGIPDSPDEFPITFLTSPYFARLILHTPMPPAAAPAEFPDIHVSRPDPTDPESLRECWEIRIFSSEFAGDPAILIRIHDDPQIEIPHGDIPPRPRITIHHHPNIPASPNPLIS